MGKRLFDQYTYLHFAVGITGIFLEYFYCKLVYFTYYLRIYRKYSYGYEYY